MAHIEPKRNAAAKGREEDKNEMIIPSRLSNNHQCNSPKEGVINVAAPTLKNSSHNRNKNTGNILG